MTLPSVPVVPQIPAGWGADQADFDSWITTPFSFLVSPPAFTGQLQAAQAISGVTVAALDTIGEDPYGGWSAAATADQPAHSWLCPAGCSGWYDVSVTGAFTAAGSTPQEMQALLYLDGALWERGGTGWMPVGRAGGTSGGVVVPLVAGQDYVQLVLYSSTAVAAPAVSSEYPSMELTWISS